MVQKFRKYSSQSAVNQFIEIREFQVAYRCQIGLKAERDITAFNNCKEQMSLTRILTSVNQFLTAANRE